MSDIYQETLLLEDGIYQVNTDYNTFWNNVGNGSNYLKATNLIVKI